MALFIITVSGRKRYSKFQLKEDNKKGMDFMGYKESRYNIFCKYYNDADSMIAFNSFTNALGIIKKDDLSRFKQYLNNKITLNKDLEDTLKEGGFLIDDSIDELDIIKYQMMKHRYSQKGADLTIAPFSGCNFRCIYCFEGERLNKSVKMNKIIQERILSEIKDNISKWEYINVVWFGGEPTMALDIIEHLSIEIIKLCEQQGISYSASMVTNGYILNKDIAILLKKCKIKSLQITVDGRKETHDKRRVLANGEGTFDIIIENIIKLADYLPFINLRVNSDKSNEGADKELLDYFKEKGVDHKISITLGRVFSDDSNPYSKDICYNDKEFFEKWIKFEHNLNQSSFSLPHAIINPCASAYDNSYVIDADGGLYKCWHEIGEKEFSFGNIKDGLVVKGVGLKYMNFDITQEKECRECKYLPICMGGCTSLKKSEMDCCKEKFILEELLNHNVANLVNNT